MSKTKELEETFAFESTETGKLIKLSPARELAQALAFEPESKTIDAITREALDHIGQRMTLTKEMLAFGALTKGAKVGDTIVIRKPVPYKPR